MRTILVSGASGIVGYGVLKSLRSANCSYKLIGTTIYDDSVAQGFSDVFEKAPLTTDPGYTEWLVSVIQKHKVALIIPGIEADMYSWLDNKDLLSATGVKILLNNEQLVSICRDKWLFYQELVTQYPSYAIESTLENNFEIISARFKLPFLLKPRKGFASKGIVRVNTAADFEKHQADIGKILMVQPLIGNINEEYTTSAFCDGAGGYYAYMTLKRKLSPEGYTDRAEVIEVEGMKKALDDLCAHFKPMGPTNFQFRLHNGQLKLLEINPRISSSTSIRAAFGYNEAMMCVEYFLENKPPVQPVIKKGRAVRYTEDFIFYENSDHI
jgi:carbamoyl-phosphate synthase large subunit